MTLNVDLREMGAVEVSIATSLALEGCIGEHPDRPLDYRPLDQGVEEIWWNLRTLIRNYLGALPKEVRERVRGRDLATGLIREMETIEHWVVNESQGRVNSRFYYPGYGGLYRKYPKGNPRVIKTELQIRNAQIESEAAKTVFDQEPSVNLFECGYELPRLNKHVWLVTHYPTDLLNRGRFRELELLESHTGVVKPFTLWYTKLHGKDLERMPFNALTLQVFGDGLIFSPLHPKVRETVRELAERYQWTPLTTRDKIRFSIEQVPHPADRAALLSLL